MTEAHLNALPQQFPHLTFVPGEPLSKHSTVGIGGPAELFCETKTTSDFQALVLHCCREKIPFTVIGWGANTLIADSGLKGLVIKNTAKEIQILPSAPEGFSNTWLPEAVEARWSADATHSSFKYSFSDLDYSENEAEPAWASLASGTPLPFAITYLLGQGITGLQWYSRIPATLGGALYNNIHGGTHFLSEVVAQATVITSDGQLKTIHHSELEAGYDYSRFHHSGEIIVSITCRLFKGDVEKARSVVTAWAQRKAVQPSKSLGCVFQNISESDRIRLQLPTTSIGYIIEHLLLLKGYRVGDAQVSPKHCAFIENVGAATADDYLAIVRHIQKQAHEKLGLELQPEIFFKGFSK